MIILSSPQGQENPTTRLLSTRTPDGKTIIRAVRVGSPCDSCRQQRILCTHKENATGEGLSRKKRQAFMSFYEGQEHIAMREYTGETSDDSIVIYRAEWIDDLLRRVPFETPMLIDMIIVSIDPAQGGPCAWGFCACYYDVHTNTQVIIQVDENTPENVTPDLLESWLRDSILSLRMRSEMFRFVPIVVACESAPKMVGTQLQYYLQALIDKGTLGNTYLMHETSDGTPGVPKNAGNTQIMVTLSAKLLEYRQVAFADVFGATGIGEPSELKVAAKTRFKDQLQNVKVRLVNSTRQDGTRKQRMDGKAGGKNDDVAVAWFMNYYWYLQFMTSNKDVYAAIRRYADAWRVGYVTLRSNIGGASSSQQIQKRQRVDESQFYDFTNFSTYSATEQHAIDLRDRVRSSHADFLK